MSNDKTSIFGGEDDAEEEEEKNTEEKNKVIKVDNKEKDVTPEKPQSGGIVKPVENVDEVVGVYDKFEEIKSRLLNHNEDIVNIGGNAHIKKSGWRKIATAFNLSVETSKIDKQIENGIVKYTVTAKAVAPNGKVSSGTGMCASNETNFMRIVSRKNANKEEVKKQAEEPDNVLLIEDKYRELKDLREVNEHNIMSTAETRAKNRAISDLVGGGEVSAEELASQKKEDILNDN